MSIVIKKDQMHVLDANGNEVAVNVLAEQKTSDVIAEIESAGTKAKAALTTQETASKNAITTQGNTVSQAITTQANQISQDLNSQYGDLAAEKVNEINDTNKTSTSKYPSVKAVADYVESETATTKDNLTKLDSRLSESITEISDVLTVGADKYKNIFEFGNISITTSGWYYNDSQSRVRTNPNASIKLTVGDTIELSDYTDARFYVGFKKNDGSYGLDGWLTSRYTVKYDGEYVILLCNKVEKPQTDISELLDLLMLNISIKKNKLLIQQDIDDVNTTIEDLTNEVSDINDVVFVDNIFMFSTPSGTLNGVTYQFVNKNTIRLNGTANKDININVSFGAYHVPKNEYLYHLVDSSDKNIRFYHMLGYFKDDGTAVQNHSLSSYGEFFKVYYPNESDTSREYIHFYEGTVFDNVEIKFYATDTPRILKLPTQAEFEKISNAVSNIRYDKHDGYITSNGSISSNTENGEVYSEKIIAYAGNVIRIEGDYEETKSAWLAIAEYNSKGIFLARTTLFEKSSRYIQSAYVITNPQTCYIAITYRTYGVLDAVITIESDSTRADLTKGIINIAKEYKNDNVKSINHRGYNVVAPENTLSAFKLSKAKGFDYVETDVSFTSDGVAVCLHDATIDRTSNGTGNIGSMTFAQVRQYDFGSWKSPAYANEKIPSFEEFILLCKNIGLHPYIELKSNSNYTNEQIESLCRMVKRHGMSGKVTWISFNATFLGYVKNYDAHVRLGYIVGDATFTNVSTALSLKTEQNHVFLDVSGITASVIDNCIDESLPVEIWTVNSEATIKGLDAYITGVTSDSLNASRILVDANL